VASTMPSPPVTTRVEATAAIIDAIKTAKSLKLVASLILRNVSGTNNMVAVNPVATRYSLILVQHHHIVSFNKLFNSTVRRMLKPFSLTSVFWSSVLKGM